MSVDQSKLPLGITQEQLEKIALYLAEAPAEINPCVRPFSGDAEHLACIKAAKLERATPCQIRMVRQALMFVLRVTEQPFDLSPEAKEGVDYLSDERIGIIRSLWSAAGKSGEISPARADTVVLLCNEVLRARRAHHGCATVQAQGDAEPLYGGFPCITECIQQRGAHGRECPNR